MTFIHVAYIIVLVKEIRTPNKKQEANKNDYH
nr:MAG TPA: hypothetical protein [Caudoviricetes sp.]DAO90011.1 MAG TPA: hypothetical protein [Caudoviricetes sp.]